MARIMLRQRLFFLVSFLIFLIFLNGCIDNRKPISQISLRQEADHCFSSPISKDHFIIEFVGGKEILTGNLKISIISEQGKSIASTNLLISNYFSVVDNHYLNEEAQVAKLSNIVSHAFDEDKFFLFSDANFTGLDTSSDSIYWNDIKGDSTSIGFDLEMEDFCFGFSKKYQKLTLLRALKNKRQP